ncbi:Uncharacterised protein [Chlamydia trachomatis]|nr:Uncharacterised protein [Chlamydia trachomatis]
MHRLHSLFYGGVVLLLRDTLIQIVKPEDIPLVGPFRHKADALDPHHRRISILVVAYAQPQVLKVTRHKEEYSIIVGIQGEVKLLPQIRVQHHLLLCRLPQVEVFAHHRLLYLTVLHHLLSRSYLIKPLLINRQVETIVLCALLTAWNHLIVVRALQKLFRRLQFISPRMLKRLPIPLLQLEMQIKLIPQLLNRLLHPLKRGLLCFFTHTRFSSATCFTLLFQNYSIISNQYTFS